VESAGHPHARAIPATLGTLADVLADARLDGPVVVMIGEVAARATVSQAGERPSRVRAAS
jgi:siroheme synthase